MKNKDKCKALFLADIVIYYGDYNCIDEYFFVLLDQFIFEYYYEYKDLFDLVFDAWIDNAGLLQVELFSSNYEYSLIIDYIRLEDWNSNVLRLLNELDDTIVTKVMQLAMLFCQYVNKIDEENEQRRNKCYRLEYDRIMRQ